MFQVDVVLNKIISQLLFMYKYIPKSKLGRIYPNKVDSQGKGLDAYAYVPK